jgi:hypothetical protein
METVPVIIFHIGNQEYLHLCLKQAVYYKNDVRIITDNPYRFNNEGVTAVDMNKYKLFAQSFELLYKHFSTNSYQLELICIVRWMYIYEYMKENNIQKAFICDSDILLYANMNDIVKTHLKEDLYLSSSVSKNLSGSGCVFTLNKLEEFVQFTFRFYKTQIQNIIKWKKNYTENGGVCDMTLLYYFAHNASEFVGLRLPNYPHFKNDLTRIFNEEFTFDLNVGVSGNHPYPNDYEMVEKQKNIIIENESAYCYNKRLNKRVRFVLLHFQGVHKKVMFNYFYKQHLK